MDSVPLITQDDIDAIGRQASSMWLGRGDRVKELEMEMAEWVGARYALALGSGTAALTLAIQLLNSGTVCCVHPTACEAIDVAIKAAGAKRGGLQSDARITIYPFRGGDIEDFAKHLPRRKTVTLDGKYGVFSFGALKDVTGGIGGCLVSNKPILPGGMDKVSPLSDINAALILSQLRRYQGHQEWRRVADGKVWRVV